MVETTAGFRLSPQQRRLWALGPGIPPALCSVRISGELDRGKLEAAFDRLVERHDILRTVFRRRPGLKTPLQVVNPEPAVDWVVEDLSTLGSDDRDRRTEEIFRRLGAPPEEEDLESGPLVRARLLVLGAAEHRLLLGVPPLLADRGTLTGLVRELGSAYEAMTDGDVRETGEPPLQYAQYSEWQHGLLEDEDAATAAEHWQGHLPGETDLLELPHQRRDRARVLATERVTAPLGSDLLDAVERCARDQEAEIEDVLFAAWQATLWRLTGESEMVLAYEVEGRRFEELAEVRGPVSAAVPLRLQIDGGYRFDEVVRRSREAVEEAEDWVEYFAWAGNGNGDGDGRPGETGAGFGFAVLPEVVEADGLRFACDRLEAPAEPCRAFLQAQRTAGAVELALRYAPSSLPRRTAERILGYFRCLLGAAAQLPETLVEELPLLDEAEHRDTLEAMEGPLLELPRGRCLHELIVDSAERFPDRTAVIHGHHHLTYGALIGRARRLAHALRQAGVGPEDRVGLFLDRSSEMVSSLVGVLAAGAAYVPLETGLPAERLRYLVEASGCSVVVTRSADARDLPPGLGRIMRLQDSALTGIEPRPVDDGAAEPANLAYLVFTSGSTGRPKAVGVEHRQIVHYVHAVTEALDLPRGGSFALVSGFAADLGNTSLFPALCFGGTLHVIAEELTTDPFELGAHFARRPVDCLKIVPSHLSALHQYSPPGRLLPEQRLIVGGEATGFDLVDRLRRSDGDGRWRLCNHYGPTETTVGVTTLTVPDEIPGDGLARTLPIGHPIGNTRIYLLDPTLRVVAPGQKGEIFVSGPGVARGYLGRPAETAASFLPDPHSGVEGGRMYRTGDLGRQLPGDAVEFLGRIDDQVKVRGFRVELGEVEATLREHPAVADAVVDLRRSGAAQPRLAAFYTRDSEDGDDGAEDLREFVRSRLPEAMVPAFFVPLDHLPLLPNGKVDKGALPEPDRVRQQEGGEYVEPRTETERALAEIWNEVLGVDRVGRNDNFFALGGDSLHCVRMLALAKQEGLDFALEDVFRHQTVADLATWLDEERGEAPAVEVSVEPFSMISEEDRRALPDGVVDAYPLARLQGGMLYHMEATPDSPAYHNVYSFHLRAPFDEDALRRAVQRVVDRYDVLRTSIHLEGFGEPLQIVHSTATMPIEIHDLRGLEYEEQQERLHAFVEEQREELFDLEDRPLWRMAIHRRTEETFQFSAAECHAVTDGWSFTNTMSEVFDSYSALLEGRDLPALAPATSEYRDFVAAERRALESEETRRFWEAMVKEPNVTRLPRLGAEPDAARSERRVQRTDFPIPEDLYEGLKSVARRSEVPLRSVALAGHLKVMSLLGGQRDVTTGLLVDGRPELPGGDQVRGLCVNTVPFRAVLGEMSWTELVKRTFGAEQRIAPHRRYPLVEIQKGWAGESLLETLFAYLNFRGLENVAESDEIEALDHGNEVVSENNFPLSTYFWVDPVPSQAALILERHLDVLTEEQVLAIYGYYRRVFRAMVESPGSSHAAGSYLGEEERLRLLERWSGEGRTAPGAEALVHRRIAEHAAARPEEPAVAWEGGRLGYGELWRRARTLAAGLRERGIGRGSRVGLFAGRSPAQVVAQLAVLEAGGAYVPLDPEYPQARLAVMIEDAGLDLLLATTDLPEGLAAGDGGIDVLRIDDDASADDPPAAASPVGPEDLAYIAYTSGSTGRPKGVQIGHGSLAAFIASMERTPGLGPDDRVVALTTLSFDMSVVEILCTLAVGATVILADTETARDGERLGRLCERFDANVLQATPATWKLLLEAGWRGGAGMRLLSGGEALPPEVARELMERGREVWNLYGPTEVTVYAAGFRLGGERSGGAAAGVPIGGALPDSRLYVVDSFQQPVPVGVPGELLVGGPGLSWGYRERPAETAEVFVPDPFTGEPGERLYRTGDRVRRLAGGELEFLGRMDDQIKIRGFRVELGEIESALAGHEGVSRAVAVLDRSEAGEPALVAFVVGAEGGDAPSPDALREHARSRLPAYMVPTVVEPVTELPTTPSGKVDRSALREASHPGAGRRTGSLPPRTPTEELLAGQWERLLGVERVGVDDRFFDLGGHSLHAARLVAWIRDTFDVDLSPAKLFRSPSLEELAATVDRDRREQRGSALPPIEPLERGGGRLRAPLSSAQERLWVLEQMDQGGSAYHLHEILRLRGRLDVDALGGALRHVVRRHEVLRTTFGESGGEPFQEIHEAWEVPLVTVDLRGLDPAEREAEIARRGRAQAFAPFDLEEGPLVRWQLLRIEDELHVLLLTIHHIVTDGLSMQLMTREVASAYEALRLGGSPRLPALEVQYPDFAAWQKGWLDGDGLDDEVRYWRRRLAGAPSFLELATDRPHRPGRDRRGGDHVLHLAPETGARLEEIARRRGVTLFMLLLAAFKVVLHHFSGQEDLVVGTDVAGRDRPEIQDLIGFFVEELPLRTDLTGAPSMPVLLERVRETCVEAYEHQGLPFHRLVEAVGPERREGVSPIFQVVFNLQYEPDDAIEVSGLEIEPLPREVETARFDMTVNFVRSSDRLSAWVLYDRDLYEPDTIEEIFGALALLLERVAEREERDFEEMQEILQEARDELSDRLAEEAKRGRERAFERLGSGEERSVSA